LKKVIFLFYFRKKKNFYPKKKKKKKPKPKLTWERHLGRRLQRETEVLIHIHANSIPYLLVFTIMFRNSSTQYLLLALLSNLECFAGILLSLWLRLNRKPEQSIS
jgi:hypothetical protein